MRSDGLMRFSVIVSFIQRIAAGGLPDALSEAITASSNARASDRSIATALPCASGPTTHGLPRFHPPCGWATVKTSVGFHLAGLPIGCTSQVSVTWLPETWVETGVTVAVRAPEARLTVVALGVPT